jgi:hypothetical protein
MRLREQRQVLHLVWGIRPQCNRKKVIRLSVTAQQIFDLSMDLIEERLDAGTISASDTISYKVRTPGLLTMLQAELIKQGDLFSTHEISNYPVSNLLGYISNFEVEPYEGTELTYVANESAKSYYFEVDNDATVYVEDYTGSWNTLETITATPTESGFTAYSGVVTPTTGATKSRLRFGGSYYYRALNRALFAPSFASASDVPVYRPWIPVTLPSDFKSVNEIIEEYPQRQYAQSANYKWEGRNKLYINYYFMGRIRVIYRPVPGVIAMPSPIGNDIATEMQIDDVTARTVVPYGLAAHLLLQENPAVAAYFNGRYEELKLLSSKQPPSASEMISNNYGGFGYG